MGMSASQANLLTLTSRLHDIEYKAQNIESQKIALATQKDELYQTYCDALDKTKIQVAFRNSNGTSSYVDATFSSVCTYDENRQKQYAIRDSQTGKVIVDSEVYNAYTEGCFSDKYSFAWAMMGMGLSYSYSDVNMNGAYGQGNQVGIGTNSEGNFGSETTEGSENLFMTDAERYAFDKYKAENPSGKVVTAYNNLLETSNNSESTTSEKQEALNSFRSELYSNSEIRNNTYEYMRRDKTAPQEPVEYNEDLPENMDIQMFNYYVNLFDEIQANGGCQEIDAQYTSGDDGAEWFNNMVTSGRVLIDFFDDNNSAKKEWKETSVATSTNQNYLTEVSDEKDLKKAEATYEYELDKINKKDTKYDQDLSKLETERTSITTEMDAIKTVRNDNIERTFGIFS
ncbi:hypothetical protein EGQ24_06920 [bacterium]|nr:hypothetical protein [bacterium]